MPGLRRIARASAATNQCYFLDINSAGALAYVSGSAGLLGGAAVGQAALVITAAGTKDVKLRQNASTALATATLTFVVPGTYLVTASGSATHNASNIRHSVQATAMRVA